MNSPTHPSFSASINGSSSSGGGSGGGSTSSSTSSTSSSAGGGGGSYTFTSPISSSTNTPFHHPQQPLALEFHSDERSYRDLLIFEERLRQNMIHLNKRRRNWEILLSLLLLATSYFAYKALFAHHHHQQPQPPLSNSSTPHPHPHPPPTTATATSPWHLLAFIVAFSMTVTFFASGMYRTKLAIPAEFVQQCNRALRPFNIEFNKEHTGQVSFLRKIPSSFQKGFSQYRQRYMSRKRTGTSSTKSSSHGGGSNSESNSDSSSRSGGGGRRTSRSTSSAAAAAASATTHIVGNSAEGMVRKRLG